MVITVDILNHIGDYNSAILRNHILSQTESPDEVYECVRMCVTDCVHVCLNNFVHTCMCVTVCVCVCIQHMHKMVYWDDHAISYK